MQKYWVTVEDCGTIHWYKDAKMTIRHRVGGPAIEWSDGTRDWYLDGQSHRVGGPAIELASGTRVWYLNGQRHRDDGPAIECESGHREWYLNGEHISQSEHISRTSSVQEMTVADIEKLLGKRIKIIK